MDGPIKLGEGPVPDKFQVELEFDVDDEKKSLLKNVSIKRVKNEGAAAPAPVQATEAEQQEGLPPLSEAEARSITRRVVLLSFIDIFAYAMYLPVLPSFIKDLCDGDSSKAALFTGLIAAADNTFKFSALSMYGRLSDADGRRRWLQWSLSWNAVAVALVALAEGLPILFLARCVHGVTQCSWAMMQSMISDVADRAGSSLPGAKSRGFGLLGATVGAGLILGPMAGSLLANYWSDRAVFALSGLFQAAGAIFCFFSVPETLPESERREFKWSEAAPWGHFTGVMLSKKVLSKLGTVWLLACQIVGIYTIFVLYTDDKYDWNVLMQGVYLSVYGVTQILWGTVGMRYLIPRYVSEPTMVWTGYLMQGLCMAGFAFAPWTWFVFFSMLVCSPGTMSRFAIQGLMAKQVSPAKQGQMQTSLNAVWTLGHIVAPLAFGAMYGYWHEGPFVIMSVLFVAAAAVAKMTFEDHPDDFKSE